MQRRLNLTVNFDPKTLEADAKKKYFNDYKDNDKAHLERNVYLSPTLFWWMSAFLNLFILNSSHSLSLSLFACDEKHFKII